MPASRALLVTRDPSLTGAVQEAIAAVAGLDLHAVPSPDDVLPQLSRPDVALLLLHLPRGDGLLNRARQRGVAGHQQRS
jgi:hypothetical protein